MKRTLATTSHKDWAEVIRRVLAYQFPKFKFEIHPAILPGDTAAYGVQVVYDVTPDPRDMLNFCYFAEGAMQTLRDQT